ncbi:MAG: helix-turn-helix transcriptional regulator [Oscillospiraceae bacterium]|nr:helix-turn-helix transcriptional regulator [Oscillospiraceae bacterium]
MYVNSGYLNNSRAPFKDKSRPLIVGSCGTYRLKNTKKLPTWRPKGRLDYQLLYIVSGKTHFFFDGKERIVTAGHMVLIPPRKEQRYDYFGAEKPEVYWVHFTGSEVKNILRKYEIPMDDPVFYSGASSTYAYLFKEMIHELQTCRTGFEELLAMYLSQIFLLVQRTRQEQRPTVSTYIQEEMEYARRYFNEHYNEPISIQDYAESRNMSVCYFQRNFKQIVNHTPMQYLLTIRVNNAASLLETTDYSMAEIAAIVGYEDPLYFSRLFRKLKGVSPSEYRKLLKHNAKLSGAEERL